MEFRGIRWNFKCANFADMSSSMEFIGMSMARAVPWNYMEFHGTGGAPNSLTRAVQWNYMEFHVTCNAPITLTRAVPWNSMVSHGT